MSRKRDMPSSIYWIWGQKVQVGRVPTCRRDGIDNPVMVSGQTVVLTAALHARMLLLLRERSRIPHNHKPCPEGLEIDTGAPIDTGALKSEFEAIRIERIDFALRGRQQTVQLFGIAVNVVVTQSRVLRKEGSRFKKRADEDVSEVLKGVDLGIAASLLGRSQLASQDNKGTSHGKQRSSRCANHVRGAIWKNPSGWISEECADENAASKRCKQSPIPTNPCPGLCHARTPHPNEWRHGARHRCRLQPAQRMR